MSCLREYFLLALVYSFLALCVGFLSAVRFSLPSFSFVEQRFCLILLDFVYCLSISLPCLCCVLSSYRADSFVSLFYQNKSFFLCGLKRRHVLSSSLCLYSHPSLLVLLLVLLPHFESSPFVSHCCFQIKIARFFSFFLPLPLILLQLPPSPPGSVPAPIFSVCLLLVGGSSPSGFSLGTAQQQPENELL